MHAWLCEDPTGVDALSWKELPTPKPKAGEVLIAIKAASLNFPDLLIVQNKYQMKPPLPFVPGSEYAGVIEAVGEGVVHLKVGQNVACLSGTGPSVEPSTGPHLQSGKRSLSPNSLTIRCRENGPLVVEMPTSDQFQGLSLCVTDHLGKEFPLPRGKRAVALCRCGQTKTRPFCDGSHTSCGFQANNPAPCQRD